jgi:putative pyruvate formate lyase activating enzyme
MHGNTVKFLKKTLKKCILCPHECRIDRTKGERGFCRSGDTAMISQALPHFGEEPPISSVKGSGTIFFASCNMKCCYCQNYQISQEESLRYSRVVSDEELSGIMLSLKEKGCHNINLVSPTIWTANISAAIEIASKKGLDIPILYNCGGYERQEIIERLDKIISIYMPDIRYSDDRLAYKFSGVKDYVSNSRRSLREMYRQVGPLVLKDGAAVKGLLIRLLVLPDNISGTKETLAFIAENLSTEVSLSIMSQYSPVYKAKKHKEIARGLYYNEYNDVVEFARRLGFDNAYIQDCIGLEQDPYLPDFDQRDIFRQGE